MRWILIAAAVLATASAHAGVTSNPAFLGVSLGPISVQGCSVDGVIANGAAAEAGLQAGDSILAVDLVPLQMSGKGTAQKPPCEQLLDIINAHQPGDRVRLDLARGTKKLVEHATLTSKADVWQRRIGEHLDVSEVTDVDDPRHKLEIGGRRNRTLVLGWFSVNRCVGCAAVFDRLNDALAKRTNGDAQLLGITPRESDDTKELRKLFGSTVALAVSDGESHTTPSQLLQDKRVYFTIVDCRGTIRLVAPLAPDADDLDASVDEVLAAVQQAEHARTRR